jgi:hypothetical protein
MARVVLEGRMESRSSELVILVVPVDRRARRSVKNRLRGRENAPFPE